MGDEAAVLERRVRPLAPLATGIPQRLLPLEPLKAMLFDVYGTLLVSAAGEIDAAEGEDGGTGETLARALRRYGIRRPAADLLRALREEIARTHARRRGEGVDWPEVDIYRVWRTVLGGPPPGGSLEALVLEVELIRNPVYPMPGFAEVLAFRRALRLPTGLVSNAQAYTVRQLEWFLGCPLEEGGLDPRLCFFSYRTGRAKPSTAMFAQAAERLGGMGIEAGATLFVGNDLRNDVLPAAAVGFRTALFAGDRRSLRLRGDDAACRGVVPDMVVTDLRQLAPPPGESERTR